jgi:hypothetical protein
MDPANSDGKQQTDQNQCPMWRNVVGASDTAKTELENELTDHWLSDDARVSCDLDQDEVHKTDLAEGLSRQQARQAEGECLRWAWNHAPTIPGRSGGGEPASSPGSG